MNILNLSNKILRGYISSREIGGSFYPQNLQNLLIRSFAYDNKINLQQKIQQDSKMIISK